MRTTFRAGARFRVREAFAPGFFDGLAPSLVIHPGEAVNVLPDESETWPAFALVLNGRGERGWVPKRCLRRDRERAEVTRAYETTTLSPNVGEELELVEADLEGGWLWCRDSKGRTGWFPIRMVEPVGVRS